MNLRAAIIATFGALSFLPVTAPSFAQEKLAATKPDEGRASEKALALNARDIPLGGALKSPQVWQMYKARFVTAEGRILDSGNGMISHSEGQGYGMLFAVAANDRESFDRIWGWTRANLMVRNDELIAWRWEPAQRPPVADMNNATDGDILVAWALTEAAELWAELSYRVAARRIAVDVGRKTVMFKTKAGALLLPAVQGFSAQDRPDGPIINLSYYVFPAFARLKIVAPEYDWSGLVQTGLDLIKSSGSASSKLPSDWLSVTEKEVKPAEGFQPNFAYNAIRIPLYMAWAGIGDKEHYSAFQKWAKRGTSVLPVINVKTGRDADSFREPGYLAVARLLDCVVEGGRTSSDIVIPRDGQNYYPATLQLLSVLAIQMRYASCVRS